ncbi:MAG: class I SAM-dependent methyltransferase [Sphingomicrobium sp.]
MSSASDRIIALYEQNAEAWDRQRGRDLFERPWLDRFVACLPGGGAQVLDAGCGMGEPIARYLIERGVRITGVDSSPSLVAKAQARFPQERWLVVDLRDLDLGCDFEGIIAWHSLIHLIPADQEVAIGRLAAHLRPGGFLIFTSGHEAGEVPGRWQGEELYHASLDPEQYRELLEGHGLTILDHRLSDPDCGSATVWLAQMSPASGLDGSA